MPATKPPPRLTHTSAAHRPPDAAHLDRLNAFASSNGLREMKWSGRNIGRVIRAGAGRDAARGFLDGYRASHDFRRVAEYRLESDLYTGAFDHGECWGRSGTPLVLVGHPYDLWGERSALLRNLRALGLDLYVSRSAGWYGFGTYHVRVSVPGALPPLSDGQRFETAFLLPDFEDPTT